MQSKEVIQGRLISPIDVQTIRDLLARHKGWNRSLLSRELRLLWDWHTAKRQIKDIFLLPLSADFRGRLVA